MKTLAVIENELFKDYVKIVSTDDLEKTLDNPDVPVPFTCLKSVDNNNADALASHLATFFQNSKVKNKEFYVLNPESSTQLQFMFDLIQLSSGGAQPVKAGNVLSDLELPAAPAQLPQSHVVEPVVTQEIQEAVKEITPEVLPQVIPEVAPVENSVAQTLPDTTDIVEEEPTTVSDFATETPQVEAFVDNIYDENEDEDPFKFTPTKVEPVEAIAEPVQEATEPPVVDTISEQEVTIFGIPVNSTLHFFKNDSITATLIDNTTVNFNGDTLTFNDAAKAAFKKAGSLGVANGLSNWLYNGSTLKALKEQNA